MRGVLALLTLLALTACGAPSSPAPQAEPVDAAPALDPASLAGHIVAMGAEPRWRLDANSELGVILVMPEPDVTVSATFQAPTSTADGAQIVSAPITLTLTPGECISEGAAFPMRAAAQVEQGEPLAGCAFVRWDRHLTEMLPAIDACIARAPTNRYVTYAAPYHAGALVRLNGEGGKVDCRADLGGANARVTPTDATLRIGGDGDAIFVRAPGANPGGECYEAPEVRDADGALLGWMDDPLGC